MCRKCIELDQKIARCRRILEKFADDLQMNEGLSGLIEECKSEKAALHQFDLN